MVIIAAMRNLWRHPKTILWLLLLVVLVSSSQPGLLTFRQRAARYVEGLTFDFGTWTLQALWFKIEQASLGLPGYLTRETRLQVVDEYFRITEDLLKAEDRLNALYTDPNIANPETAAVLLRERIQALRRKQALLQPFLEAVLEAQVAAVVQAEGLTELGQPLPPVAAHITPLPYNLVISRRDRVEQITAFMLRTDLTVEDFERLEQAVEEGLDVSALVVPVGGVGTYPTMVQRTANLDWILETFAHEWIHNYLERYPLGRGYSKTPELRTINETTASLAGKEIRDQILTTFYPPFGQVATLPNAQQPVHWVLPGDVSGPPFDFRAFMHATRLRVDELLAAGQVDEAERYMETQRRVLWQMGYRIRKLNQAYFAFYGAYADVPGGASGEDPVGPAVRRLREQSPSLGAFLRTIREVRSFEELQAMISAQGGQ